jgi:hypothetical protein
VEQHFLRKKYKDPITNDDFQVLTAGASQPGQTQAALSTGGRQTASGSAQTAGRGAAAPAGRGGTQLQSSFGTPNAGIVGVTSKSPLKSLRLYNNQDTYNQWIFMPVQQTARAGGAGGRGADGRGADGRGGRGPADGRGSGFQLEAEVEMAEARLHKVAVAPVRRVEANKVDPAASSSRRAAASNGLPSFQPSPRRARRV